jgi:hypothetical protein
MTASCSEADRRRGDIVIFERLQRPCLGLLFVKDSLRRSIYLVEIIRADELLQYRDVWVVRRIQGETLGKGFEQPGVVGRRVLDHCRVGFERDVDRCDGVFFSHGPLLLPNPRNNRDSECGTPAWFDLSHTISRCGQ